MEPEVALSRLGAIWSPDVGAYAAGEVTVSQVRCALCGRAPCDCPEFGTPAYFTLVDARHGRRGERR